MWKKMKALLIVLSVGLNVAFVVAWAAHALPARAGSRRSGPHGKDGEGIWCPLHRDLGTSEEQWREIEPRLKQFQARSRELCRHVNRLRGEMIDLVAAPEPDRAAIEAKQNEVLAGQRKMQDLVIDHLLAEKQLLSPDQQKRLFEMIRQRSRCAGHGPMMGSGRGGGRGMGKALRDGPEDCPEH
ncbi:MAG: Spy/CpxP family protein refolding chaperone [bacterium]